MKPVPMMFAMLLLMAPTFAPAQAVAQAATSASAPRAGCAAANLRIVGPRTKDRPLPLMSGDGAHGFRPACSVPWSALSPRNEPLSVEACFRDSLLQLTNDSACGASKGKLWVSARWVLTSTDAASEGTKVVVCQQLETGAYAGTRELKPPCVPANATPAASAPAH